MSDNITEINTKAKRDQAVVTFEHSDADEWANSPVRAPVFSIVKHVPNPELETFDGPDEERDRLPRTIEETVTHTMPARPNAGLALAYLREARRKSPDEAMSWLIETAVGVDGYDDLVNELATVGDQGRIVLEGIVRKIQVIAMGGLEAPKG
jgi:hypothetical protein